MFKKILPFLTGLGAGAGLYIAATGGDAAPGKVHVTTAPLLLYSNAANPAPMMLPTGTAMYYDTSFDEGFSRYLVYIKASDKLDLAMTSVGRIDPIDARPLRKESLLPVLKVHPLTRQDLEKILRSDRLTKDDVKQVLSGFTEAQR
jgi:hypothetical protein